MRLKIAENKANYFLFLQFKKNCLPLMLHISSVDNIKLTAQLSLKPEYKIHPTVSGNKYRKLKYNLKAFKKGDFTGILTFGGAFSNHIAATAAASEVLGIPSVGIIRGLELAAKIKDNPTLGFAQKCGMKLEFINPNKKFCTASRDFLPNRQNMSMLNLSKPELLLQKYVFNQI